MIGLRGNDRNGLNSGRSGADDPNPLAGEVDALVRPFAGMVPLALKGLETLDVRHLRGRETADRGNQERGGDTFAGIRFYIPPIGLLVKHGGGNPRVELDVPAQVQLVRYKIQIAQDLRLFRIATRPLPFLLDLFRE